MGVVFLWGEKGENMVKTETKTKKRLRILLISVLSVILILLCVFFGYVSIYNHATENAVSYLKDSESSKVDDEKDYVSFVPKEDDTGKGFLFYPGGKVEYKSYAPFLRGLSDQGITSVLLKMPFNLAVFDVNAADNKQSLFPEIKQWYIGGHSLGGAMASDYLFSHSDKYKGLILFGSYSTKDLSSFDQLSTLSVLAQNDKVLNKEKYEMNRKNLPNLTEITIEGGIHSYFGDYGIQSGDGVPSISFDEQNQKMVSSVVSFVSDSGK